jgi:hypothetical protein
MTTTEVFHNYDSSILLMTFEVKQKDLRVPVFQVAFILERFQMTFGPLEVLQNECTSLARWSP